MPNSPPAGFVTRPEAAKIYNRSQRALERDLDVALEIRDDEVLEHFKLVTKDGEIRQASDLTTDDVKELVSQGMSPVWYVEESWLDARYARKGSPKPRKSDTHVQPTQPPEPQTSQPNGDETESGSRGESTVKTSSDDTEFLKQQIAMLEREKQSERERNDKIVAKLFEQLAVKDKQISAWDDVTQGLTKALATGQLTPQIAAASHAGERSEPSSGSSSERASADTGPPSYVEVPPTTSTKKSGGSQGQVSRQRKSSSRKPSKARSTSKRTSKARTEKTIFECRAAL